MIVNKENRDYYIRTMAHYYGKTIKQIEKEAEDNSEMLEGWAEHLANDLGGNAKVFKHYGNNYYE